MGTVLFILLITIVFVAIALAFANRNALGATTTFSGLALGMLLLLVFIVAPIELGVSQVPSGAEEFTRRLEGGKVYKLIATDPVNDDGEKILLVSDELVPHMYYAIRVKILAPIPERFTLIDGQPVEVK